MIGIIFICLPVIHKNVRVFIVLVVLATKNSTLIVINQKQSF